MQVLRFYEFCLKIYIHTACSFGDKGYDRLNGEQPQRDPQKTLLAHAETRDTTHRETVKIGQPVLHSSPFYTTPKSYALQCCSVGQTSKKYPFHGCLDPPNSTSQTIHLDRFSRFCTVHGTESLYFTISNHFSPSKLPTGFTIVTDRQTLLLSVLCISVCNNMPHLADAAMRLNNNRLVALYPGKPLIASIL